MVGLRVGQRPQQDAVHHAEDRRVHTDTDAQRQERGYGEHGSFPQAPESVTRVLNQVLDPAHTALIADLLLDDLHSSKAKVRLASRLSFVHPEPHVPLDIPLEMEANLLVQLILYSARREQCPDPVGQSSQPAHRSLLFSTSDSE